MTKFILKVICVVETSLLVGIAGIFIGMLLPTAAKMSLNKKFESDNDKKKKHERPYGYGEYSHHYYKKYEDEES